MLAALAGGILIGLSAFLMYASLGKIAGISGITYAALDGGGRGWRLPFLLGLVGGAWLAVSAGARLPVAAMPSSSAGIALIVVGGLLVGLGTRLGNGCTSGHGVCGLSRLSPRSAVAVAVFMLAGVLTATLLRGLLVAGV